MVVVVVVVVVVVLRIQTCRAEIGELPLSTPENVSNYRPVEVHILQNNMWHRGVCVWGRKDCAAAAVEESATENVEDSLVRG